MVGAGSSRTHPSPYLIPVLSWSGLWRAGGGCAWSTSQGEKRTQRQRPLERGTEVPGGGGCGWEVGVGNRKFRRAREATGKTERGGRERQALEVQPGH